MTHPLPRPRRRLRRQRHPHLHARPGDRPRATRGTGRSSAPSSITSRSGAAGGRVPPVPRNVGLPWLLNSKTDLNVSAGPYAAFLGQGYDPVWTDFDGPGTKPAPHYTADQKRTFLDPFAETPFAGRFRLSSLGRDAGRPAGRTAPRAGESLLAPLRRPPPRRGRRRHAFDKQRSMAFAMLTSGKMREALDLSAASRWPCASATARRCSASRAWRPAASSRRAASSSPSSGTASASSRAAPGTRTATTTRA